MVVVVMLLVAMVTLLYCYYGNHAKGVQFFQSDAHIHCHCQETHNNIRITVVNCGCHGNHCGRLYMSPRVNGRRYITLYSTVIS